MLKYENKFVEGDQIKAFDFEPCEDREDRFVIGTVIGQDTNGEGAKLIKIVCTKDSVAENSGYNDFSRVGLIVRIPMEVAFSEFDGRVTFWNGPDINKLTGKIPAAACRKCGGWTNQGGMSQYAESVDPVMGRTGCTCKG